MVITLSLSGDDALLTGKPNRENKGNNIIDFPFEYIAIDVETTDLSFEYGEIIEVSALHVRGGKVCDKFTSLVQPTENVCVDEDGDGNEIEEKYYVSEFITKLTGITNEMLQTAPSPADVIPCLADFIGNHILVGHNTNFDVNFLYDAYQRLGLTLSNDYVDTMRISRKLFPDMPHHRLRDLVEKLDVQQDATHRAEADAAAAMKCLETMKAIVLNTRTIEDFQREFKKKSDAYNNALKSIVPNVDEFDTTNPVYDKVVVFTGTLSSMTRAQAFQIVANLGGHPENRITMQTNFLVIGNEEFASTVKNGKTNKMKKADSYRLKGCDIAVLSEDTFFDIIR